MKTLSFLLIIGFIVTVCALAADAPAKNGKLRHVVAFKFKDTATQQQIKEVEDAFRALKGKIPEIISSTNWFLDDSGRCCRCADRTGADAKEENLRRCKKRS